MERIQNGLAAALPKIDSLKSVRRIRSKDFPRAPRCIEELHIPKQFRNSLSEKAFLLFDSYKNNLPERTIIFATKDNLEVLGQCDQWFADGTFKSSHLFLQLYVIHGLKNGIVIPLVYALMTNQSENAYDMVLGTLQDYAPDLNP